MPCPLEIGQQYAYRESRTCYGAPVTPVEVIKIEPRIKGRVRVVHIEGDYSGLKEWVPKQRLLVPWSEADALCADERRALAAADISYCTEQTALKDAVDWVFSGVCQVSRREYVVTGWTGLYNGLLRIRDFDEAVHALVLDRDKLLSEPGAFIDRTGQYVAPFSTAVWLAQDFCMHFPAQIASYARHQEADCCQKIAKAPDDHRFYEEQLALQRQANALIRQWCPEADWDEVDERLILREEVRRLRGLLESAIQTMESRRLKTEAALLRKELEE